MSDLNIVVKLDPNQAVAGAKAVSSATDKLERDANEAGAAYDNLTKRLARTSQEMDRLAAKERSASASSAANAYTNRAPGIGSQIGTGVGNALLTGASMAGAAGIADVALKGAAAWVEYEHAQTDAFNSLRKFFTTADQTNTALESQQLAASHLSVGIREQAAALADVREASEGAYLSTLQQIDATRTLGEAMQIQGKPVSEAGNVMKQLQLAMEVGTVTGLQFKTMLRENDDVVEVLAARTGKSAGELLKMAKAGQFGRDMIKEWFLALSDGTSVHEEWNKRQKVGIDLAISIVPVLSDARAELEAENRAVLEAADAWEKFGLKFQEMHDNLAARQEGLKGGIAGEVIRKALRETAIAAERATKEFDEYTKAQERAARAAKQHAEEAARLAQQIFAVGRTARPDSQHAAGERAKMELQDEVDRQIAAESAGWQEFQGFSDVKGASIDETMRNAVDAAGDLKKAFADAAEEAKNLKTPIDKLADDSLKSLEQAAQSAGAMLVDAFFDGEFSADKFFKTLARQLASSAVSNLIGAAFGGLGGGATGFDAMVGGGRGLFLPGFATGGDMLVGGAGGTDSRIAAFRVTPGESIHVRTPEQRSMAAQSGGSSRPVKVVNMPTDRRALLQDFDSREGDEVILNAIARRASSVRSLLG